MHGLHSMLLSTATSTTRCRSVACKHSTNWTMGAPCESCNEPIPMPRFALSSWCRRRLDSLLPFSIVFLLLCESRNLEAATWTQRHDIVDKVRCRGSRRRAARGLLWQLHVRRMSGSTWALPTFHSVFFRRPALDVQSPLCGYSRIRVNRAFSKVLSLGRPGCAQREKSLRRTSFCHQKDHYECGPALLQVDRLLNPSCSRTTRLSQLGQTMLI
jgi:hypothetical protein